MMERKSGKISLRKKVNQPNFQESFEEIDDEIEGKRTYDITEKLEDSLFEESKIKILASEDVSFQTFQRDGFDRPILVKEKDGLGLKVPGEDFTVRDVMSHVGAERLIDVINTETQSADSWSMEKWVKYYESDPAQRKRIWNSISLEFTGTMLDPLVESPKVVREIDWAQKAWPLDLMYINIEDIDNQDELTFPKVLKYCLMSVAGCYTDFHIDLGGTSVWYHILRGKKIFWLIPPTEENLQAYIDWSTSGEQEHVFLADKCSDCQRISLSQGSTFFIPTGWIHAVYTPEDSLVFGGNYLHSYNVELQLRSVAIEETLRVGLKYRYPFFPEMMWYVYDHYNIALTGTSFLSTSDNQPLSSMCEIVEATPVLSKYELHGLKCLREWLPNQESDTFPDTEVSDGRQQLLDSMLVAIMKHSGDGSKSPCPADRSVLQWDQNILNCYQQKWASELKQKKVKQELSSPKKVKRGVGRPRKTPVTEVKVVEEAAATRRHSVESRRVRRARCGRCPACLQTTDCRKCLYCRDKSKYGGSGKLKQTCSERRCVLFTADSFKALAGLDPKQTKLNFAKQRKEKEVPAESEPIKELKIKLEPSTLPEDVLTTPKRKVPDTEFAGDDTHQQTLTQFVKRRKKSKTAASPSQSTADTSAAMELSPSSLGYSQPELKSLLDNANSDRLNVNGDLTFYRDNSEEQIKVMMSSRSPDLDRVRSAVTDQTVKCHIDAAKLSTKDKKKLKNKSKDKRKHRKARLREARLSEAGEARLSEAGEARLSEAGEASTEETPQIKKEPVNPNLGELGEIISGASLVKRVDEYLSEVAKDQKSAGSQPAVRMVFLCMSQAMDEDSVVVYMGHVMTVAKECYLFRMSQKPSCKKVKIKLEELSISLPMVFPKPQDLIKCQSIGAKPFMVEEEKAPTVLVQSAEDQRRSAELNPRKVEGQSEPSRADYKGTSTDDAKMEDSESKTNSVENVGLKEDKVKSDSVQETLKREVAAASGSALSLNTLQGTGDSTVQSDSTQQVSDSTQQVSDSTQQVSDSTQKVSDGTQQVSDSTQQVSNAGEFIIAMGPDNVVHRLDVRSTGRKLSMEETFACIRKAGYTPIRVADSACENSAASSSKATQPAALSSDHPRIFPLSAIKNSLLESSLAKQPVITPKSPASPVEEFSSKSLKLSKRRVQCGTCENCRRANCKKCVFCRDMKKYGGPGKMKQRCLYTRCKNMKRELKNKYLPKSEKVIAAEEPEMSPSFDVMMRGLADVGAETPDMTESLLEETDQVSEIHKDVSEKHKDVSSDEDLFPVRRKVTTPKLDKAAYQDMLKVEASAVRKLPNCGECVMCLDKPQFGGKNKKKQMCQVKKKELQQRLARMERENNMEGQSAGSDSEEEAISSRLSSRRRKLTQKMEESMDQAWHESVSVNMTNLSDYASSLLDNYLESLNYDENDSENCTDDSDSETVSDSKLVLKETEDQELNEILMYELMEEADVSNKVVSISQELDSVSPIEGAIDTNSSSPSSDILQLLLFEDILVSIFKYLPKGDLLNCALVCKAWYGAHKHPSLWRYIDLTKRTIDESMAESVVRLQPECLSLNKAITSKEALNTLISGLTLCQELSMKGVTALTKLGLSSLPSSVESLNISSIPSLTDVVFATMFRKELLFDPMLTDLDVSNTSIGDPTLKLIAKNLFNLCSLNVSGCSNVTNAGFTALTSSKRVFLQELEMNDCEGIDSECLQVLESNKLLKSINFNGCPNISLMDIKNFVNTEKAKGQAVWRFSRRHLQRDLDY